jgi:hypothetical protein
MIKFAPLFLSQGCSAQKKKTICGRMISTRPFFNDLHSTIQRLLLSRGYVAVHRHQRAPGHLRMNILALMIIVNPGPQHSLADSRMSKKTRIKVDWTDVDGGGVPFDHAAKGFRPVARGLLEA